MGSNTYAWTPTVANPNYQVGVWVRSAGITADTYDRPQSTGNIPFAIGSNLTLSSLTPDKAAPQPRGTTVTFTATATGGTAPYSYKWWVFDGATWVVVQNWMGSNTYAWTPTVANPNYQVGVWVRSAGITADTYDRQQSTGNIPFPIQ
jgi:cell wall-associated protease